MAWAWSPVFVKLKLTLSEQVRRVLKQKWYRFRLRHGLHTSGRRRNSRTSSFFLTSATEVHPLRALKNKMCPDFARDEMLGNMNTLENRRGVNGSHVQCKQPASACDTDSEEHDQPRKLCACASCCWTRGDNPDVYCACCDDNCEVEHNPNDSNVAC